MGEKTDDLGVHLEAAEQIGDTFQLHGVIFTHSHLGHDVVIQLREILGFERTVVDLLDIFGIDGRETQG